eukprot:6198983-Pleurochrysis_carterae.AAC.1
MRALVRALQELCRNTQVATNIAQSWHRDTSTHEDNRSVKRLSDNGHYHFVTRTPAFHVRLCSHGKLAPPSRRLLQCSCSLLSSLASGCRSYERGTHRRPENKR